MNVCICVTYETIAVETTTNPEDEGVGEEYIEDDDRTTTKEQVLVGDLLETNFFELYFFVSLP